MFHFDANDAHFQKEPAPQTNNPWHSHKFSNPSTRNDSWVSPGFAGAKSPAPKPPPPLPKETVQQEIGDLGLNGIHVRVIKPKKRRPSVVLQGQKAVLITTEDSGKSEDEKIAKDIEDTTKSLAGLKVQEPARSRSKSPARRKKSQKNKEKKKNGQIPDIRSVLPSLKTSPEIDMKDANTTVTAQPISFPKRLSPPRINSMVSSLSTSFQEARANFPQLTLDTSNGASELKSKLALHAGDIISVEGHPGSSYEVQLEEDFMSPDVRKKSPLQTQFDAEGDMRTESMSIDSERNSRMCAEDFEPLRMLGKGTYGTVLLVRQKSTGRLYAQKQLKKASIVVHTKMVEQTKTERNILESIRHPFVVKLFYAFQDHKKLYLILEYAQGGELFNYLATENIFTEDTTAFYIAELVLALTHLHNNVGVVYRDLKPENCLLDAEGHLLMTDFGLSKVAEDGARCKSVLGTPEYMAPEILQGKQYGFEVDWWSLGALTYDLLTGGPPFPGNNHTRILEKIQKRKLQLPYYLSAESKDFLTRLLRKEPSKRLGANMPTDFEIIKKHRFFRKIDWKKLERRELEAPIRPLVTDPVLAENFAKEFTDAQMSPVVTRGNWGMEEMNGANPSDDYFVGSYGNWMAGREQNDPFGGFSFQAGSVMDGYFRDF